MITLHMLQILLWTAFYRRSCFPSWEPASYFSTASYSTAGSGDLLLPLMWRTLGPVESITGVLMCGLSVSFLFAIMLRLVEREIRLSPELLAPSGKQPSTPVLSGAGAHPEKLV
jgi:voltage-gated potassium channel